MTFCQGHPIQDGQPTAIYGRNLFLAITLYWIEILTSNFVCWHFKIKSYNFLSDSRWPTDDHIWSKPILRHNSVLDWDIDFKCSLLKPQNKILWPFVKVIQFKMADRLPYMVKTFFWAITMYWIEILTSLFFVHAMYWVLQCALTTCLSHNVLSGARSMKHPWAWYLINVRWPEFVGPQAEAYRATLCVECSGLSSWLFIEYDIKLVLLLPAFLAGDNIFACVCLSVCLLVCYQNISRTGWLISNLFYSKSP